MPELPSRRAALCDCRDCLSGGTCPPTDAVDAGLCPSEPDVNISVFPGDPGSCGARAGEAVALIISIGKVSLEPALITHGAGSACFSRRLLAWAESERRKSRSGAEATNRTHKGVERIQQHIRESYASSRDAERGGKF
jgi:hypothetical protein